VENYDYDVINNDDLKIIENGKIKKRSCCKHLVAALKNSKEELSIEDVIQRCCNDTNEIYLFLDELMIGNFHENFIDSVKKNLMNHVKILYMNKNGLTKFDPCIFSLSQIVELNLEENAFRKIPEEIREMHNLVTLNISSNNLVDLPYGLASLPNLKKLYANFNEFRQFPPIIMDIPNLEILHIQYNPEITTFPPKEKLEHIKNLNINIDNSPELVKEWNTYYNSMKNITITWNRAYPNNIIDGLYLGGVQSTWNDYVYKYFNINAVFTVGRDLEPLILMDMTHKEYIIDDIDGVKINFTILNEIHNCLQQGNRCLVHCFAGVSRSSTMVIAYLMKHKHMRLGKAYDLVKSKRKQIHPNDGFWKQLILLDQFLFPDAEKIDYTNWRV
jgi:protein-tyrosine phosphatase